MAGTGSRYANLNLKVSEDERWEFKEFCAKHRMSQIDGFRLAFELLKGHLENDRAQNNTIKPESK